MSATVALSGWLAALGVAAAWRIVLARRMELIARACHELRGPLTAARLALHYAAHRPGAPQAPLEAIELELGRAGLALADLHAAQHGGRATDRAQTFDIGVLLVETGEAWRSTAWARDVTLRVEQAPGRVLVRGDRVRLSQACGNLVANAIEHGGGEVVLRARAGTHVVRIEVLDDGPGLPAAVPVLVGRARGGRGTRGRGLAIAADVAARHGGRLAAAPAERGARLVLELPTLPASASS
jgi:signal transduction histidine kinase